jgi:ribosomal protein S18 acetylase RimI-like enzyme
MLLLNWGLIMHIDEANLSNLTKLWHQYGSQLVKADTLPILIANIGWPRRCWIDSMVRSDDDSNHHLGNVNNNQWVKNIPGSATFSLWPTLSSNNNLPLSKCGMQVIEQSLLDQHWHCAFEQTAMYLTLSGDAKHVLQTRTGFKVRAVDTFEDIKVWVDISSDAFANQIDLRVIQQLINLDDIQLLLGWENNQAVASGLLYKTGDIIGVHQVGVKQAFQGKGLAKCLMLDIIAACAQWQGKYVVLQASQAGKPLYEKLGFKSQFLIKNFKCI